MNVELTIRKNLSYLLKINEELTLSELARQTKIPQPTLHHLLKGNTKKPRRQVLEALASFFSISIAQLIGTLPLGPQKYSLPGENLGLYTIPIIEWTMLKDWPLPALPPLKEIFIEQELGPHSFALSAKNSPVKPLFPENALLIFDTSRPPKDRELALIYRLKASQLVFNKLFEEENELFILSDQKDGNKQLVKINREHDKIIGTLIEVRLKY